MKTKLFPFDKLLAPLTPAEFFSDIHGRKSIHLRAATDRFGDLFDMRQFYSLLNMNRLWRGNSLKLVLDNKSIATNEYCISAGTDHGPSEWVPIMSRVQHFIKLGATVVLDYVDTLTPGINSVSNTLQAAFGSNVLCNVYCSFKDHAGFTSHFDVTDVIVLQIEGVKRWHVYEGRFTNPTPDAGHNFDSFDQAYHDQRKGKIQDVIDMQPGDVLYVPRGVYHDAIATSPHSLHLTFGLHRPNALNLLNELRPSFTSDDFLRAEFPFLSDINATKEHLIAIANRLQAILNHPEVQAGTHEWQRGYITRKGLNQFDGEGKLYGECFVWQPQLLNIQIEDVAESERTLIERLREKMVFDRGLLATISADFPEKTLDNVMSFLLSNKILYQLDAK